MSGYVLLHRSIIDNDLWLLEPFTKAQAWVDLFMNANFVDGAFSVRGNIVKVKRGQIGWSELTLAKRWKWSRNKTRAFLAFLEREGNIVQQKSHLTTIITICNYERFQFEQNKKVQQKGQQKDNRRTTEGTQYNKGNKGNKNIYGVGENIFLTDEQHDKLKQKLNGKTNEYIDRLSTYKKLSQYKDHYLTILSWWSKDEVIRKEKVSNDHRKLL